MLYRSALQAFEWLAVAAATGLGILAYVDGSPTGLAGVALTLIGAIGVRSVAISAARGDQVDGVLKLIRAVAPDQPADDDGRCR